MADLFDGFQTGLQSPATHLSPVTPDDGTDLPMSSRAINVAETGTVQVTTVGGSTATIYVSAGVAFPIRARRIWASGTTATGLVVLY